MGVICIYFSEKCWFFLNSNSLSMCLPIILATWFIQSDSTACVDMPSSLESTSFPRPGQVITVNVYSNHVFVTEPIAMANKHEITRPSWMFLLAQSTFLIHSNVCRLYIYFHHHLSFFFSLWLHLCLSINFILQFTHISPVESADQCSSTQFQTFRTFIQWQC